jgi:hypothetical protein
MAMSENNHEYNDDNLDVLLASIDKAKSTRDARDAAKLAKLRHKYDTVIDTIMKAVPSVTRVFEISERLDAIREFKADPYSIWRVGYEAGIIREEQENDTRICGIGIMFGSRRAIALLPEQEYDRMLREKDVAHVHVAAGIYNISWEEDEWGTLVGPDISPLEFADAEWGDMDMWHSYEYETDNLEKLAKALTTFEDSYWSYARDVVEDVADEA